LRYAGSRRLAVTLAVIVTLLAAAGPALADFTLTEEQKKKVPLKGESRIYVKNARGKTIIVGRKGVDAVSIHAERIVRDRDSESAQETMDQLTFEITQDGEQISIITNHPDRVHKKGGFLSFLWHFKHKAYVDYTIEVPTAFHAKVSSASGDVQITSIEGQTKVFGSSGDVFLKDLGGRVFVEISSGDVEARELASDFHLRMSSGDAEIRDVAGTLNLNATSGSVFINGVGGDTFIDLSSGAYVLKGCRGSVEAKTNSGDGQLANVDGSIRAISSSGDLYLAIVPVGQKEFTVQTSSGDVEITFRPEDKYGFSLDVNTSSGTIEGDLDIDLDRISRRVLRGVVGSGESKVVVETSSGDIRIQQARR
jgi:DUF4097 and DUF4098 domain-containing protein YvlB